MGLEMDLIAQPQLTEGKVGEFILAAVPRVAVLSTVSKLSLL